ncbi:tryptophan--tRNA ligase [Sediminicurvatus halobius]|uniref:Tryptophan--tRNA ligase n=2 Tax=Sediminicurvatus halobius TaxID=2182432 RepID=A0A2U2N330_9GAMM|nr:tryptophan--tRNA ligase [Spiribacter halobius]PWG63493.1 tryptophan--tRNA ligase [Spiribacter halobius]UEX79636.1 tryptophan--tRNA ligase [Spiribacter halobius]
MSISSARPARVLSGMRPTGRLHLGHYHGVLKNWVRLQEEHECFFFIADWHALTTAYEEREIIAQNVWDLVVDWLACGVNPRLATLFIQSRVIEHAELHLLLSMIAPLGWLERVPTYKDQIAQLREKDLATYGFLGYPVLQSADILIYRATGVPVGEDQVSHVELTRELARRFNWMFGREPGFEARAETAARKMGKKNARLYRELRRRYQEAGDGEALAEAKALIEGQQNITLADGERLLGYLEGGGRTVLPEPEAMLTPAPRMPGLDGRKMSKSYGNTISLREAPEDIDHKLRTMPTDPARVRRSDPGEPTKCPVYDLHRLYSDAGTREWVEQGCRSAGIGCLDCKQPLIEAVQAEVAPIREKAAELEADPDTVRQIVAEGCERARGVARETMKDVRAAMGLEYR